MSERKGLVLDANILIRAVLGQRVRQILEKYEDKARFYTPDICFEDARRYIPVISNERLRTLFRDSLHERFCR
jgi:predicted nucleic acid-binding protein